MSGLGLATRVDWGRGSRVADFARDRGSQGAGRLPPATLPTPPASRVPYLQHARGGQSAFPSRRAAPQMPLSRGPGAGVRVICPGRGVGRFVYVPCAPGDNEEQGWQGRWVARVAGRQKMATPAESRIA